jgi:hypothetical protein
MLKTNNIDKSLKACCEDFKLKSSELSSLGRLIFKRLSQSTNYPRCLRKRWKLYEKDTKGR